MKIGKGTLPSKIIQKMWILDKHAHLKKVNMQEINFQQKSQITRGLQILIWKKMLSLPNISNARIHK